MKYVNLKPTIRILINLTMFAIFPLLICNTVYSQSQKPINKDGLLAAVRLRGFSAKELAKQIEARGVSFEMTAEIEAEMRGAGAPSEVIEAARSSYRAQSVDPFTSQLKLPKGKGALTVHSVSGCQVFLNGQLRGTTNNDGALTVSPLKPGAYKVRLKRNYYEAIERSVVVTSGNEATENFTLTPLKGNLSVIPNLAGAIIRIRELEYPDTVRNLSLEPGDYEIKVTKSGYRSFSQVITIAPGQPFSLPVNLEVLNVDEMVKQAKDSMQRKDFARTISITREILAAKPEEPKANLLLGLAYFNVGNYDSGIPSLIKAISLGEQVGIPVQRHTKYGIVGENDSLTPGVLIIGKNLLEFRTLAGSPLFSVPFEKVYRILQEDNRGGRLQIKVGNPAKKKDGGKDYNFHPMKAGLRQVVVGSSVSLSIYCENCMPITQGIYQLLQRVQSEAQSVATPKL